MKKDFLYSVSHFKEFEKEDCEQRKRLGIFFPKDSAEQILKTYQILPGFIYDTEEELFVAKKKSGLSFWDGGFTTVAEIMSAYGTIIYDNEEEFTDVIIELPYWFRDQQEKANESSEAFAARIMQEKYNTTDYPRGPQSEFFQIKRFKELNKKNIPWIMCI